MDRKTKTIFQLDTPFTASHWPRISVQEQDRIIELLCSLLSPIGQYRSNNINPSKGKRSKKRKRKESKSEDEKSSDTPSQPEISSFVVTGLNSINRMLEESSKAHLDSNRIIPSDKITKPQDGDNTQMCIDSTEVSATRPQLNPHNHFAAIFVSPFNEPTILNAHLPELIATASRAYPTKPGTRLVQLPKRCDIRIATALGIPRATYIGILDSAPHTATLVDLVRECVAEIEIPWVSEVRKAEYLAVKINSIETSIGPAKTK